MFAGRPELSGATWSWTCETASHALRLIFGGVFLRHPTATVILGHMGETHPFDLWRLDSRALTTTADRAMPKPPSQQIRENLVITTSGVCADAALRCSLAELGPDRVMFATDYPYEDAQVAAEWIQKRQHRRGQQTNGLLGQRGGAARDLSRTNHAGLSQCHDHFRTEVAG